MNHELGAAARFANRVCSRRNASLTMPVGPLRCLATISSAMPAFSLFGSLLYTSSVDEHDNVGILLEGARLAKVGELGPVIGPRLGCAAQLRQRDDRDVQLLC